MSVKPHISPALFALRGWVTTATILVAISSLTQLLTFAVVRYTDARVEELEGAPNTSVVVAKQPIAPPVVTPAAATGEPSDRKPKSHSKPKAEPADPNLVRSVTDRNLELASSTTTALGLISLLVLVLTTGLGAALSSAGAVPGVELTVRAFVWSAAALGLGLPWSGIVGPTMYEGTFCAYPILVAAAETGGAASIIAHVVAPTLMMTIAGLIALWFRKGTVAGLILTSLSEVDEALEREMSIIRARGVTRLNPAGRAAGSEVLQQTFAPERVAVPEAPILKKAAGAESMSARSQNAGAQRPI